MIFIFLRKIFKSNDKTTFPYPQILNLSYRVAVLRFTDRLDAEAKVSVSFRASDCLVFAAPSLSCHQIAIGLAMAMVE